MRSAIVRASVIFAVILLISESCAALIWRNLPPNRTSSIAAALILTMAILEIGGPIIGLFLAISSYRRATRDPVKPTMIRTLLGGDAAERRKLLAIFVVVGISVGFSLLALGIVMVIPAAWLAGGGDRPPGPKTPQDPTILYIVIAMAAAGAVLLAASLVVGIILLLTRKRNGA
jgi:hypothetical protein